MLQIITILQNKADKHQHNVQRSEVKWYHSNFYRRIWYYYYYNIRQFKQPFHGITDVRWFFPKPKILNFCYLLPLELE